MKIRLQLALEEENRDPDDVDVLKTHLPGFEWATVTSGSGATVWVASHRRDVQVWQERTGVWCVYWHDENEEPQKTQCRVLVRALQGALDRGLLGVTDPAWGVEDF